ncbi:hypothetical protein [Candidatus Electrothrix sp.]|uniref:hypothetical protein n=1 Tax=Candidatus Electrothrix sp. TaxID=2170559 RepID=UPI004055DB97
MNNFFQTIWSTLGSIALLHWIATVLLGGFFFYFRRYIKVQWRFRKNLKREVYFLKTSGKHDLQAERKKLIDLNVFNIAGEVKDISMSTKILQPINKNAVYIVGYDTDYTRYKELFESAKPSVPIIIFADQREIQKSEHWTIFNEYIYCDVANTTHRLAIILLNTLKIV